MPDELKEMEDLLFNFRRRWAELLVSYDYEKADVQQNFYEVGSATLDYLQSWIDSEKDIWEES